MELRSIGLRDQQVPQQQKSPGYSPGRKQLHAEVHNEVPDHNIEQ